MQRKTIATAASAAALLGAVALPASAAADYYVPPGNSAVNQYTESFPGAGGETGGDGGKKGVTPAQTLGAGNAKRLEQQGQAGREAAEVAAETAPPANLYAGDADPQSSEEGPNRDGGGQAGGGSGGGGQGGNSNGGGNAGAGTGSAHVNQPSGSSGLGSVLGQATGAGEGGNIGLWLPLAILATLAGTVAYRLRLRHEHGPTA